MRPHAPSTTYTGAVGSIPAGDDVLDPDEPIYDLPRVAELLGVPVTKVQQQLREGHLIAVRRGGGVVVPQVFFTTSGTEASWKMRNPCRKVSRYGSGTRCSRWR